MTVGGGARSIRVEREARGFARQERGTEALAHFQHHELLVFGHPLRDVFRRALAGSDRDAAFVQEAEEFRRAFGTCHREWHGFIDRIQ